MRIKEGFVLREIAGQVMVIATGEASKGFNGMIKLNGTGKEIWQGMQEHLEVAAIAKRLQDAYGIDEETAMNDTKAFIAKMEEAGFLVNE